jgi:hypothetical protein
MINLSCSAAAMATSAVVQAARLLLSNLKHGRCIDAAGILRSAMESAFGAHCIELSDFSDTARDWLRAYGLFSEIISRKLHMFVPTDASGVDVLTKVHERYPVEHIGEREAA